ncbi:patatin-like phospholipase family protein [Pseudoduganella dura]|uniref:patatin-like phospholipase family protein n=1 Tax=Pseudoduganella dura TaxID=321982 RepID=UPI0019B2E9C5|nr:patatin-like phospholipase family protein [Pseudoduganella dura]GGY09031.1 membrane protein [Pseudoduganella dura]
MNRREAAAAHDIGAAPAGLNPTEFDCVALVLQGGGALGAYQAGVYERLLEEGIEPTWLAGISIGAINSAIIAGNAREDRVARLREFWELVSGSGTGAPGDYWTGLPLVDTARAWVNGLAAGRAIAGGAPGFFEPRVPPPYLVWNGGDATSYYDTAPLRATLERLVDFDRINARQTRLSVGAVNVRTGNFAYFDNATHHLRPEHIMASGALPPGFDAVEIDGEQYWDGGMVSNTPLEWVLSCRSGLDTLVLQVDLWSAHGELPRDLASVATRMKEIQYSSRTRAATDAFRRVKKLRTALAELLAMMPGELAASPQARLLAEAAEPGLYNIVELVYRSATYESQYKDVEFSRRTMEEHWSAGYADADTTLAHKEILRLPGIDNNPALFDFLTKPAQPTSKETS